MLVSFDVIDMTAGVTEQSSVVKKNNHVKEMMNVYPSPAHGCVRRPPLQGEFTFFKNHTADSLFEIIKYSDDKPYLLVIEPVAGSANSDVNLIFYDIEEYGSDPTKAVTFATPSPYLRTPEPKKDLQVLVSGDSLFILNRSVEVLPKVVNLHQKPNVGLVYVKQTRNNLTFNIYVNDSLVASARTLESSTGTYLIDTVDLTTVLLEGGAKPLIIGIKNLNTELNNQFPGQFTVEHEGNVIKIFRVDGGTFSLSTDDGFGDECLSSTYDEIQTIGDLNGLHRCFNGILLHVVGSANDQLGTGFFMKFKTNNGQDFGIGTWIQTNGWHSNWEQDFPVHEELLLNGIDASTMPHQQRYLGTNPTMYSRWYNVTEIDWAPRVVGNDISSPMPSFVSKFKAKKDLPISFTKKHRINSIFVYQNRFGILSGQNVVFSVDNDYFNFWRQTATDILDSDPIDLHSGDEHCQNLNHAVQFNDSLLLCGETRQFIFSNIGVLSPRTVKMNLVSNYRMDRYIPPKRVENFLIFFSNKGQHTAIMQYIVDFRDFATEAVEITAHVPTYIPGKVESIAVSQDNKLIVVIVRHINSGSKPIYVYKYYWDNGRLLQSAWFKWDFPKEVLPGASVSRDIIHADFIGKNLYLIGGNNNNYASISNLFKIDLSFPEDEGMVCLDVGGNEYYSYVDFSTIYLRDDRYETVYLTGKLHILRMKVFLGCNLINNFNVRISVGRRQNNYNTDNRVFSKKDFAVQQSNLRTNIRFGAWKHNKNFKLVGVDFVVRYSDKTNKM
jgi:hypothetical protein